jgi:GntR family transcriptional regulator
MSSVLGPVKEPAGSPQRPLVGALDRTDPTFLHDQVAAEIRRAINEGEAKPGERIPQARDLATVLGVNTNTVLRALHVLRDEGLIEMGRGRATTVAGTAEQSVLQTKINELLDLARYQGYRRDELVAMIRRQP